MPDMWLDVDTAITAPVNILPLIDDTDFKSRETGIVYNQAGMDLVWNFQTCAGVTSQTAVTPTTGGVYDWTHSGDGMYKIEIPASGGGSINNDVEGFGWFSGICTGVLAWRGPVIGFRAAALNNALIDGGDELDVNLIKIGDDAQSMTDLKDFADAGYDPATNKIQGVVLVDTTTVNTDMVTEPPTAVQNRQEMDSNSTELAKIGTIPALDGAPQTIGAAIGKLADDNGGADFDATDDSLERIANTSPLGTAMRGTDGANTTKTGYALSPPGIKAIWDQLISFLTTTGSIGKLLVDNINATISSRSSHSIANIWDALTSGMTQAGSVGKKLADWLLNSGKVTVGTNDDKSGYSLAADQSGVTIGVCSSNSDMRGTDNAATAASLSTHDGKLDTVDTVVDAIKAKTDNLPTDPASETNVNANETKIDTLILNTSRALGLSKENVYEHTRVYSGGKLTSVKVDLYDSKANAETHDGSTGIVAKNTYTLTYSGDEITSMLCVRDS